jgi:hypothetical protein
MVVQGVVNGRTFANQAEGSHRPPSACSNKLGSDELGIAELIVRTDAATPKNTQPQPYRIGIGSERVLKEEII